MPKQITTTRKRREWAAPRAATLKGNALRYPAASADKYSAKLTRLVAAMRKEYERELQKLFRDLGPQLLGDSAIASDASLASQARILFSWLGSKYAKLFAARSVGIVETMIGGVDKASKISMGESLKKISGGITIPVPDMPGDLRDKITASTAENVGLIKSISGDYHQRISQSVLRSIQAGGNGAQDLLKEIRDIGQSTEKRAELIAVDQTRKVTTAMNVERAKSVGMKKFEWLHSGGGVDQRKLHLEYDGQVFDYDNPPVIDKRTGERGFPGQLINCRCTMVPVLSFGDDEE